MSSPPATPSPRTDTGFIDTLLGMHIDVRIPVWCLAAGFVTSAVLLVLLLICRRKKQRRAGDSAPRQKRKGHSNQLHPKILVAPADKAVANVMDPKLAAANKKSTGDLVATVSDNKQLDEILSNVKASTKTVSSLSETVASSVGSLSETVASSVRSLRETVTGSVQLSSEHLTQLEARLAERTANDATRTQAMVREMCTAIATVTAEAVEEGIASLEKRQVAVIEDLEARQEARMLDVEKRMSEKQVARQQLATMAMAEQMEYLATMAETLSDVHRGAAEGRRQVAERRRLRVEDVTLDGGTQSSTEGASTSTTPVHTG